MFLETIPSFIILLGILITVHELGHFLVAKKLDFKVLRFCIGFGPILWKKQWGETEYALAAIPLGGYVKFHGEEYADDTPEVVEEEPHRRFFARPVPYRIATVVAGPLMNFVLGVVLFSFLSLFGVMVLTPVVGEVSEGMPAWDAGILPGDRIVEVDGVEVDTWTHMSIAIATSGDDELALVVDRKGERIPIRLFPDIREGEGDRPDRPVIGISRAERQVTWYSAPVEGLRMSWQTANEVFSALARFISGEGSRDEVGGPIAIAGIAGKAMRSGVLDFLYLMAGLSVNLAILNLLPIPVLDGGLLVFLLFEAVRGKPLHVRYREVAQQIGLAIILTLIMAVVYVDVARIVESP